mgnify:CR=1 FL=1
MAAAIHATTPPQPGRGVFCHWQSPPHIGPTSRIFAPPNGSAPSVNPPTSPTFPRVIISGGGTGGHIYPAVAIANEIKARFPQAAILFVGALGRMEMVRVPEAGYEIQGLRVAGLQRRLTLDNLAFPFKLISAVREARRIVQEFRPDVVVGVGGYASAPTLLAATNLGLPTLIQEQNSYAGLTNKLLGKRVNRICVAYEGMERFFPKEKLILTGNPVRSDILSARQHGVEAAQHFGLAAGRPTVLLIGGSLGARTLNQAMAAGLRRLVEAGCQVVWQTGKTYHSEATSVAAPFVMRGVKVFDFIKRMELAFALADVVVSRAGALSISELSLTGHPTILVPSPNVAEDHQTKNAQALAQRGAALLMSDADAAARLIDEVLALVQNSARQESLRKNLLPLGRPNATAAIVNEVLALARR